MTIETELARATAAADAAEAARDRAERDAAAIEAMRADIETMLATWRGGSHDAVISDLRTEAGDLLTEIRHMRDDAERSSHSASDSATTAHDSAEHAAQSEAAAHTSAEHAAQSEAAAHTSAEHAAQSEAAAHTSAEHAAQSEAAAHTSAEHAAQLVHQIEGHQSHAEQVAHQIDGLSTHAEQALHQIEAFQTQAEQLVHACYLTVETVPAASVGARFTGRIIPEGRRFGSAATQRTMSTAVGSEPCRAAALRRHPEAQRAQCVTRRALTSKSPCESGNESTTT